MGVILPLFKDKEAKANNKDNYRGITMFPALCKIYEMILLNRLEAFAKQKGFIYEMHFGFQEGVGCIKASFVISETINHLLERGSKVLNCFSMFGTDLTPFGLTVSNTNYSQSWEVEAEGD